MENSHMEVSCIWKIAETQKPDESLDQKYWKKIFISSCLCAILLDPLFLYIPILKNGIKCIMLDPKLKIVVLLLRSLTDCFYLMDIIIRIYRSENYSGLIVELNRRQHQMNFNFVLKSCVPRIAQTIWVSYDILIDIIALLPLPQVAILTFFSKMSDLRFFTTTTMVIMNIFALFHYVPRVLRIYLSFKELKKMHLEEEIRETPMWIKGVLNFFMYIIASHVVGALCYFFAIQRMMICWHSACRKNDGCDNRMFGCHDHHFFRNTTILNDLCPVSVGDNSSDTMFFDFGIFATVLKYGVVGSTSFFKKLLNCFCWGLRNLSSFGSNLEASADVWENLYTVFISTSGLILFLYLIGNLQMYMQFETTRREDHKRKMLIKQKVKEKGRDIELWLFKRGVPTKLNKDMKLRIMEKVQQTLEEGMEIKLDDILHLLPSDVQSRIEGYMPLAKLKQVPMLRGIDEDVLKIICQKLEPVRYTENNDIIQKDKPLDQILYIVDGDVSIEEGSSYDSRRVAGQLCGEELLRWPFYSYFPWFKMFATESVKAIGVVEALALYAQDLRSIYEQSDIKEKEEPRHRKMMEKEVEPHMNSWLRKNGIPEKSNEDMKLKILKDLRLDYWDNLPSDWYNLVSRLPVEVQDDIKPYMPLTKLKEMPLFKYMDESVLKQICSHLQPEKYYQASGEIIKRGEPIQMFFVVEGYITDRSFKEKGPSEIDGEELLVWPFLTSFPYRVPTAAESPYAVSECSEVLVLTAEYIKIVATEFRKHFIKNYGRLVHNLVDYASPAITMPGPSTSEAGVRFFIEEEIKKATENYSCHNYKIEGGYGIVYEAALHRSGRPVAIKTCISGTIGNRFIQSQHLVLEAFVLSQIRHNNVIRLLGCCLETKWPIMVYDRTYARTLDEHIRLTGPKLLLQSRMKIAAETAGALKYLHSMSVVHQDVKTANILIDPTTHNAKLSGFGASRLLDDVEGKMVDEVSTLAATQWLDDDNGEPEDEVSTLPETSGEDEVSSLAERSEEDEVPTLAETQSLDDDDGETEDEVSTLPETLGYLDPEYLEPHVLTEKSDVYSFGVVLVELLTSQAAVSSDGPERSLANVFLCEGRLRQILDREVFKDEFSIEIAEQVRKLAVTCLGSREERPSMEDVAAELDGVVQTIMNKATPSTFFMENMSSGSRTSE